jgi:hypothetical protein
MERNIPAAAGSRGEGDDEDTGTKTKRAGAASGKMVAIGPKRTKVDFGVR